MRFDASNNRIAAVNPEMESVTSRQNAIVRTFRELATRRTRDDTRLLLEGEHLVGEALAAGLRLTVVAVATRMMNRRMGSADRIDQDLVPRLQQHGARMVTVSENVMAAISPVRTPSGIVAIAEFSPPALNAVMNGQLPLVPLLAGIQDPGNLGAAARTAEASGATGLVACLPSADPFGWKALRGAMGSLFRLPVPERVPLHEALLAARRRGLVVVAAVPRVFEKVFNTASQKATADGRGRKYSGRANACAMSGDPTIVPSGRRIRLPSAWKGNTARATAQSAA